MYLVDFEYDRMNNFGGDLRSKLDSQLPNGVQFLSSQLTPVNNILGNSPTQLAQDLLEVVGPSSVANQVMPGSTLISFNDSTCAPGCSQAPSGIFGLLQTLSVVMPCSITTNPYLYVANNQEGTIETQDIRRTNGELVTQTNGNLAIPVEDVSASIKMKTVPHILSEEKVRLSIALTVERFTGVTGYNRLTRELQTTATLRDGQILVLGGLLRDDKVEYGTATPFFGSIPIIGWFFKGFTKQTIKTNLTLFISPTIIVPKRPERMKKKAAQLICDMNEDNTDTLFDPRDPISRLYFKKDDNQIFNSFLKETETLHLLKVQECNATTMAKMPHLPVKKRSFKMNELKQTLAAYDQPFLPIKKRKGKIVTDQRAKK